MTAPRFLVATALLGGVVVAVAWEGPVRSGALAGWGAAFALEALWAPRLVGGPVQAVLLASFLTRVTVLLAGTVTLAASGLADPMAWLLAQAAAGLVVGAVRFASLLAASRPRPTDREPR